MGKKSYFDQLVETGEAVPLEKSDEVSTAQAVPKQDEPKQDKSFFDYLLQSGEAQEAVEQEQLDSAPDLALLAAQGASQDFLDEGAGVVGQMTGKGYTESRDAFRGQVNSARERQGLAGDVVETLGNVGASLALPGGTVAKELGMAALNGVGSAPEMKDVPYSAVKSGAISAGTQLVGKGVGAMFKEPEKILARTVGNRKIFFKNRKSDFMSPDQVAGRLDKRGFFRQGEVVYNPLDRKWVPDRSKSRIETFFKPQGLADLEARSTNAISTLKHRNNDLLKGKIIPVRKVIDTLQQAALDFMPEGYDVAQRQQMASNIVDKLVNDIKMRNEFVGHGMEAINVEKIKTHLYNEVKNTFHKAAKELPITDEAQRKFSAKLDDLVDSYGGPEYKHNNDLMHDLLTQHKAIDDKMTGMAAQGVESAPLTRGEVVKTAILDTLNPASVGVARARTGQWMDNDMSGEAFTRFLKRAPVEMINNNQGQQPQVPYRAPQSVPNIPEQFIRTPLPRTTEGLMQNKKFVLGKVAQMAPDMFESVQDVFEHNPENLPELAQVLAMKMPHFFEKDKYNRFDGRILSEKDKSQAVKDTLLNTKLSSIEQAKIITRLNKEGLYDH